MRITTDPFVNSTAFLNVTTRETPTHHEEEFNYNWLIGVGIFLFILFTCSSRGNRRTAPNRSQPAPPPQNRQTSPTPSPPAIVSSTTTPPANESTLPTLPLDDYTSSPGPTAVSSQGMEDENTHRDDSVSPTAPPPSYDSIMSHPSMPPPNYDTVVKWIT